MSKVVRKEIDLGGKRLVLETGELASQANAAVLATYGETVILATAVSQKTSQDIDYFPLSVEYEEKLYAGGRISTSRFIKRENRPSEAAVLTARLIDRSIRPLFPKDFQEEVQVIVTVLSIDHQNNPDILSLIAVSAALTISDIPWNGPLSGLRVGMQKDKYILNPTAEEKADSPLEIILASNETEAVMIEAAAKEVDEKAVTKAIEFGLENGKQVIKLINDLAKEVKTTKKQYESQKAEEAKDKEIRQFIDTKILKGFDPEKMKDEGWFSDQLAVLEQEFIKEGEQKLNSKIVADILEDKVAEFLRKEILVNKKRIDGRSPDDIRPISIKVGVLPRTHGSALFQRGETQGLTIATLGSPSLEQLIEGMDGEQKKRYMHHYNFPPFSVGETRRRGAPGRREVGHGALAEKAMMPVIPPIDTFPYTIRVVTEILSSAGSTSMAAVCGSTLSLMDAGVPIKEPVAGISIGLITEKGNKNNYVTIVDIAYQEDAQGDMDFKVAGTKNGVTAIQMDIKLDGIPPKILEEALEKAKSARLKIIDKILQTIPNHRDQLSKYAPTVILVKIDPSKIGEVIGSGGRTINKIIAETGAAIDINDDGIVTISGTDRQACQKAAETVEAIVKEFLPGEIYEGKVKRILPFGAMVEIVPGKEGLVHISKLAPQRVENVTDVVNIGDDVKVRVAEIDDQGRVNLSMIFGENPNGEMPERQGDFRNPRGGNRRPFNRQRPPHRR